jgi:hypothetical protein
LELGTDAPVVGADDALRAEIAQRRRELQDFYAAGLAAYKGDREGWSKAIERVMTSDPNNPYYRWIAGGSAAEASR